MKNQTRATRNPPPKPTTALICAWCGKVLQGSYAVVGDHNSHGICEDCRKKYFPATIAKGE